MGAPAREEKNRSHLITREGQTEGFKYKQTAKRVVAPSGYKSLGSNSSLGFDSPRERFFQDLTTFVLSVVGDVPVDSETPVVTSSILRNCRHSLRRCS
jgi:hypothetical protein